MSEIKNLFASGHKACQGCTVPIMMSEVLRATGKNVIVVNSTGCLETFSAGPEDYSCWEVPYIHPLFENAASVATGVAAALEAKDGNKDNTQVIAVGGDGSSYDIGFGAISGTLERNDNVIYICYDNEAYMNTGVQRSSATPYGATTTTSPSGDASFGNVKFKKDMPEICRAHGIKYVATATVSDLNDLNKKVKKAMSINGASYLHVLVPCNTGWGIPADRSIEIARMTVNAGMFPVIEYVDGELNAVKKIKKIPVTDVLFRQKRFKHLKDPKYADQVEEIQKIADRNIERYGLV